MNRFIIVVGSRNNGQWVESNISSILNQDYPHYHVVYFNDASEDDTEEKFKKYVGNNKKFTYIQSNVQKLKSWFYSTLEQHISINDNDILVFLDGDDMFYCENVLSYIDAIYKQSHCWMTYGGMVVWDGGDKITEPYPQNSEIPIEAVESRSYRKDMWRTSHLKTMRGIIWKKIDKKDLTHDDKYIVGPDDLSIMFSALEICPPNKVFRITEPIYLYNHTIENQRSRAYVENINNKIDYEGMIRNKIPYDEVSVVSPTLAGGLGNQMFEIAAAASLAKDNNAILVVNNEEHILPNQGKNVNTYSKNVFSKIIFDSTSKLQNVYIKNTTEFTPIPYQTNLKLHGHFQSFKYFDHNKEYIKQLFLNKEIINVLREKYNILDNSTAIQVRRGDYYKFPNHHPLLSVEYYKNAVKMVNSSKIYIFSDDIDWCKKNLIFENVPVEYIQDEDYNELYFISLCKNIIISNSSFGWWAAYLHQINNANIIVPSIWFGKSITETGFVFNEFIPSEWKKIEIV